MGHGNGWPSPYPPFQTLTKDGLGLNPTAGTDNSTTKYYGESYIDDVALAPNAVVILGHLCYSAGNSEGGDPEPDAERRQAAGRQHGRRLDPGRRPLRRRRAVRERPVRRRVLVHPPALHDPPDDGRRSSGARPTRTATSSRSRRPAHPGYTVEMDPQNVNAAPFRRAMTGKPGLLTTDVTGARYAATDRDPTTLAVPGAASVKVDGAGLFADRVAHDARLAGDPAARHQGPPRRGRRDRRLRRCTRWRARPRATCPPPTLTPARQPGPGRLDRRGRHWRVLAQRRRQPGHVRGHRPVLRGRDAGRSPSRPRTGRPSITRPPARAPRMTRRGTARTPAARPSGTARTRSP